MNRRPILLASLAWLLGLIAPGISAGEDAPPPAESTFSTTIRPILAARCFDCHAGKAPEAGLDLSRFADRDQILGAFRIWEKVRRRVEAGEMPPEEAGSLRGSERQTLLDWHRRSFIEIPPRPGPSQPRRLNRTEYRNTLADLLGMPLRPNRLQSFYNVESGSIIDKRLPPDPPGPSGFDNDSSVLSVSPEWFAKALEVAEFLVDRLDSLPDARQALLEGAEPGEGTPRQHAQAILARFATRAFRRPISEVELAPFLAVFDANYVRADGGQATALAIGRAAVLRDPRFVEAIQQGFTAILISPSFLYRLETVRSSREPYRIGDFELATRLSYFLWSTMPDDELFLLAANGRLHESEVLNRQVERMLADGRSIALAENFGGQWFGYVELDNLDRFRVSRSEEEIKLLRSMYREPLLFFDDLVRSDRSLLELVDSRHTFLNPTLGYHYRLKGYKKPRLIKDGGYDWADPLVRVPLDDPNRGGMLSMAATLVLTAAPERTSPVRRGVWILDALLGQRPGDPPPNIPPLEQPAAGQQPVPLRLQIERHRSDVSCARCHDVIDPLGLALENFGPLGEWRDRDASGNIDATATLPGGEKVSGPAELRRLLMTRYREPFLRNAAERMLSYGLGRAIVYSDRPTIDRIMETLKANDYRFSALVKGVVKSVPFCYREN